MNVYTISISCRDAVGARILDEINVIALTLEEAIQKVKNQGAIRKDIKFIGVIEVLKVDIK